MTTYAALERRSSTEGPTLASFSAGSSVVPHRLGKRRALTPGFVKRCGAIHTLEREWEPRVPISRKRREKWGTLVYCGSTGEISNLRMPGDIGKFVFAEALQLFFGEAPIAAEVPKNDGEDRVAIVIALVDVLAALTQIELQVPQFGRLLDPGSPGFR